MISENKVIIKPLMVGSIVVLYEHFQNGRGLPMMTHYKIGGLAVGASFVSNFFGDMMELPDTLDFVKSPILSGLVFAVSKKYVLGSRNSFIMDSLEGGGAELVSSLSFDALSSFW